MRAGADSGRSAAQSTNVERLATEYFAAMSFFHTRPQAVEVSASGAVLDMCLLSLLSSRVYVH